MHSAGTQVVLSGLSVLSGLARCHDTNDTNRCSGDTRTIRWIVKMVYSENVFSRGTGHADWCL